MRLVQKIVEQSFLLPRMESFLASSHGGDTPMVLMAGFTCADRLLGVDDLACPWQLPMRLGKLTSSFVSPDRGLIVLVPCLLFQRWWSVCSRGAIAANVGDNNFATFIYAGPELELLFEITTSK
jgi:hypothetical protein